MFEMLTEYFLDGMRMTSFWSSLTNQDKIALFSAIFMAFFAFLQVLLNLQLARETKRIREVSTEPDIDIYLIPHEASNAFMNMVIRNNGGGAARGIKWKLEYDKDDATKRNISIGRMNLFTTRTYIPAKEEIKFFFGSSFSLLKDGKMAPIHINVSYTGDNSNRKISKEFVIDIGQWEGMSSIGTPPLKEISDNIRQIKELLGHLLSGSNPPLVRVQKENEYQQQKSEYYKTFAEQIDPIEKNDSVQPHGDSIPLLEQPLTDRE